MRKRAAEPSSDQLLPPFSDVGTSKKALCILLTKVAVPLVDLVRSSRRHMLLVVIIFVTTAPLLDCISIGAKRSNTERWCQLQSRCFYNRGGAPVDRRDRSCVAGLLLAR